MRRRALAAACATVLSAALAVVPAPLVPVGPGATGSGAPRPAAASRARVLVLGDSVFAVFDHVPEARAIVDARYPAIYAVTACQKLLEPGCKDFARRSALDELRRHAGRFTDAVVVGTGYNDRLGEPFRRAVLEIVAEAERQGVRVVWATYRERGPVRGKGRTMNRQLAALDARIERLSVADWNAHSRGRDAWFRPDQLHLLWAGGRGLATHIVEALDAALAPAPTDPPSPAAGG